VFDSGKEHLSNGVDTIPTKLPPKKLYKGEAAKKETTVVENAAATPSFKDWLGMKLSPEKSNNQGILANMFFKKARVPCFTNQDRSRIFNVYDAHLDDFNVGNALETMMSFKSLFALDDCDVRDYCNVRGVHNGLGDVRD
jgi:hypothetical protein